MRIFLDNCISPAMARAIKELAKSQDLEVIHLSERFPRNTPDVEWIAAIAGEEWIIISGDTRISRSKAERAAWYESGLTAFFLDDGWMNRRFWVQAAELIRWFPTIIDTAKACKKGSGFLLKFKATDPIRIFEPA